MTQKPHRNQINGSLAPTPTDSHPHSHTNTVQTHPCRHCAFTHTHTHTHTHRTWKKSVIMRANTLYIDFQVALLFYIHFQVPLFTHWEHISVSSLFFLGWTKTFSFFKSVSVTLLGAIHRSKRQPQSLTVPSSWAYFNLMIATDDLFCNTPFIFCGHFLSSWHPNNIIRLEMLAKMSHTLTNLESQ